MISSQTLLIAFCILVQRYTITCTELQAEKKNEHTNVQKEYSNDRLPGYTVSKAVHHRDVFFLYLWCANFFSACSPGLVHVYLRPHSNLCLIRLGGCLNTVGLPNCDITWEHFHYLCERSVCAIAF